MCKFAILYSEKLREEDYIQRIERCESKEAKEIVRSIKNKLSPYWSCFGS